MCLKRLLSDELQFIDQQTVDEGHILLVPELVDEWSHDSNIDPWRPELVKTVRILNAVDYFPTDAVDGPVYWQIRIGIRRARGVLSIILFVTEEVLVLAMAVESVHLKLYQG